METLKLDFVIGDYVIVCYHGIDRYGRVINILHGEPKPNVEVQFIEFEPNCHGGVDEKKVAFPQRDFVYGSNVKKASKECVDAKVEKLQQQISELCYMRRFNYVDRTPKPTKG